MYDVLAERGGGAGEGQDIFNNSVGPSGEGNGFLTSN